MSHGQSLQTTRIVGRSKEAGRNLPDMYKCWHVRLQTFCLRSRQARLHGTQAFLHAFSHPISTFCAKAAANRLFDSGELLASESKAQSNVFRIWKIFLSHPSKDLLPKNTGPTTNTTKRRRATVPSRKGL